MASSTTMTAAAAATTNASSSRDDCITRDRARREEPADKVGKGTNDNPTKTLVAHDPSSYEVESVEEATTSRTDAQPPGGGAKKKGASAAAAAPIVEANPHTTKKRKRAAECDSSSCISRRQRRKGGAFTLVIADETCARTPPGLLLNSDSKLCIQVRDLAMTQMRMILTDIGRSDPTLLVNATARALGLDDWDGNLIDRGSGAGGGTRAKKTTSARRKNTPEHDENDDGLQLESAPKKATKTSNPTRAENSCDEGSDSIENQPTTDADGDAAVVASTAVHDNDVKQNGENTQKVAEAKPTWRGRLEELRQYKSKNGDANVPQEYPKLGSWVANQRTQYRNLQQGKTSSMTAERIAALEAIGFVWKLERGRNVQATSWERRLEELRQYRATHGDVLVPRVYKLNPALGHWVGRQREEYRKRRQGKPSKMTPERIDALEDLGFVWDCRLLAAPLAVQAKTWEQRLEELRQYRARHGDALVPQRYKLNSALGGWVQRQREEYRKRRRGEPSKMTPERIDALEDLGFVWDCRALAPPATPARNDE